MQELRIEGIVDSTLREGEQRAGVVFPFQKKLEIARQLSALGIEEIEIGVASPRSLELLTLTKQAKRLTKGKTQIALWCRCREDDIVFAHQCRPDTLSLSMPVSDILIRDKLCRDRAWVLERLERSINRAYELGFRSISVGLEDATRADLDFLLRLVRLIDSSPASRLRLADTLGVASPGHISKLVKCIRDTAPIDLGIHTHNDFGMATANAIAALEAGAQWIDATVLGLGERTGNCRLEEIVGYLALQKGMKRYDANALKTICHTVAEATKTLILPHHPVVGEQIFTCESGLHVCALALDPKTYEPFDPVLLGRSRTLLFGSKTGRKAVQLILRSAGITPSNEQIEHLVETIRQNTLSGAKPLLQNELIHLARQNMDAA